MLHELVNQAASSLTDVQRRVEDAVNDIARSAVKGVGDIIGSMMSTCEDGGVGEVGASAVWSARAEE